MQYGIIAARVGEIPDPAWPDGQFPSIWQGLPQRVGQRENHLARQDVTQACSKRKTTPILRTRLKRLSLALLDAGFMFLLRSPRMSFDVTILAVVSLDNRADRAYLDLTVGTWRQRGAFGRFVPRISGYCDLCWTRGYQTGGTGFVAKQHCIAECRHFGTKRMSCGNLFAYFHFAIQLFFTYDPSVH